MSLDPLLVLTARGFLALLLLAAGLHKITNLTRLIAAIAAYRIVPTSFERPVAWLVIGVEVTVGAALVVPSTSRLAAPAAAAVFALYFALMGLVLLRGDRKMDCGCSFQNREAVLSSAHLVRNVLLVILALAAFGIDSGRLLSWVDEIQIAAAVMSLALIYLSADALLTYIGSVAAREARR